MKTLDVYGLYGESWQNEIAPDAFSHPAKFSRSLIRWIYQHCIEKGYIKPGDRIVDPFGGVALGGLDAMRNGLHWHGVELEQKFVDLGQGYDCPGFTKKDWQRYHGRAGRINYRTSDPRQKFVEEGITLKQLADHVSGKTVMIHGGNAHHWCTNCQKALDTVPEDRIVPTRATHRYRGNIDLWNERYAQWFREWGTAQLIQGDSRQLGELVAGAQACVGSPPFSGSVSHHVKDNGLQPRPDDVRKYERTMTHDIGYGNSPGQLGSMPEGSIQAAITSPPFGKGETRNRSNHQDGAVSDMMTRAYTQDRQGTTEGNLATLKADTEGYAAAIGSPPFHNSLSGKGKSPEFRPDGSPFGQGRSIDLADYGDADGQLGAMKEGNLDAAISSPPYADAVSGGEGPGARHDPVHHKGENSFKKSSDAEYGSTPGNLGNMAVDGVVTSPPFESQTMIQDVEFYRKVRERIGRDPHSNQTKGNFQYGSHSSNIGNDSGETFWTAAKTIVEQVYMVLKPGGYSVWVCKDFVRNKERVEFSDQWQALCEACGFVPVERIRAWVIEERGTQGNLFTGEFKTKTIERKSFFRRLAERKGSPRIDWEDVIILRKPL